jgi:hypothetical protein
MKPDHNGGIISGINSEVVQCDGEPTKADHGINSEPEEEVVQCDEIVVLDPDDAILFEM